MYLPGTTHPHTFSTTCCPLRGPKAERSLRATRLKQIAPLRAERVITAAMLARPLPNANRTSRLSHPLTAGPSTSPLTKTRSGRRRWTGVRRGTPRSKFAMPTQPPTEPLISRSFTIRIRAALITPRDGIPLCSLATTPRP